MKVFLGGTCNGSTWRDELIKLLTIDYFNPIVDDWTPECQEEELKQRKECDFNLYCITPEMTGVYSIAEVVDGSNKRPSRTLLVVLFDYNNQRFSVGSEKSLRSVIKLVESNGSIAFNSLQSVAEFLNNVNCI